MDQNVCSTQSEDLMRFLTETDFECICCPIRNVCTTESGVTITITNGMILRSNCSGAFADAFEEVSEETVSGIEGKTILKLEDHFMNPDSTKFDPDSLAHDPERYL